MRLNHAETLENPHRSLQSQDQLAAGLVMLMRIVGVRGRESIVWYGDVDASAVTGGPQMADFGPPTA